MNKEAKHILTESCYDALIIDYIDERFDLVLAENGAVATLSEQLKDTGLERSHYIKRIKMRSLRRLIWWYKAIREVAAIADKKGIPVILPRIYPALYDERGQLIPNFFISIKNRLCLYVFYRLTPKSIKQIVIPSNLFIQAEKHHWGVLMYHYTGPFYTFLAEAIDNSIDNSL